MVFQFLSHVGVVHLKRSGSKLNLLKDTSTLSEDLSAGAKPSHSTGRRLNAFPYLGFQDSSRLTNFLFEI